jgi:hypothetical protein
MAAAPGSLQLQRRGSSDGGAAAPWRLAAAAGEGGEPAAAAVADALEDGLADASAGAARSRAASLAESRLARYVLGSLCAALVVVQAALRRETLAVSVVALSGPLAAVALVDAIASAAGRRGTQLLTRRQRQLAFEHLHAVVFSFAASGVANVLLGGRDLLWANIVGAFLSGLISALVEGRPGEDLAVLELFRASFTGVLTSQSGIVLAAAAVPSQLGALGYYGTSLAAGACATAMGANCGRLFLNKAGQALGAEQGAGTAGAPGTVAAAAAATAGPGQLTVLSHGLLYAAAYLSAWCLLDQFSPRLLAAYAWAALAVAVAPLLTRPVAAQPALIQGLWTNAVAVSLARASASAELRSEARLEFESSFCGTVSSFCGSAKAAQDLLEVAVEHSVARLSNAPPRSLGSAPGLLVARVASDAAMVVVARAANVALSLQALSLT